MLEFSKLFKTIPLLVSIIICFEFSGLVSSNSNFDVFNYCIRDDANHHQGLKACMGRTAISFLQSFDEHDNYTIFSDFIAEKDEDVASRSIVNFLDQDPVDFRGIMESAGALISERSLQWRLDNIYPGLMFKIGPSADSKSVAEFVMDTKMDERFYSPPELSSAKILTKQYLLPMLLGFKFNIAVLVPLVFGLIVLLLKKSLFLVKIAIYISSVLGVGGAASLATLFGYGGGVGVGGGGGVVGGGWPPFVPGHGPGPGLYPAKDSLIGNYPSDSDIFSHDADYSRKDRKVVFNNPQQFVTHSTQLPDRFYDYEKSATQNPRSSRMIKVKKLDNIDFNEEWNGDGWHVVS